MQTISLTCLSYDKASKTLRADRDIFGGGFPSEFTVVSHHTGEKVIFRPIGPDHPMFDQDGWDGEMAVYEPVSPTPGVAVLVLTPY